MELKDIVASTRVALDVQAAGKTDLIQLLADRAAEALNMSAETIAAAVAKREELGSTGFGGGVAIPHARLSQIRQPFSLLVRLSSPIDFEAIDSHKVDLVWLLLLPLASQSDQPQRPAIPQSAGHAQGDPGILPRDETAHAQDGRRTHPLLL